jgi:cytoskeleton protein RodZ
MVEEKGNSQAPESSRKGPAGPVGGERLAASRRERGISVHEIAKELRLDDAKVRALEENRFDDLGAPVFAKGHMRKYAELVGVPIDDMLADYYQLNRSVGAPPVVGPPRKVQREISAGPWIAGGLGLLVLTAAAWWWTNRDPAVEAVTVEPATLAPFQSERQDDPAPVEEDAEAPAVEITGAEVAEDAGIAAVESAPQAIVEEQAAYDASTPDAGSVELVLSFSGDCWTEVSDATGRRLYFGLGTDGRSVTVNGVEPLGVLLGNGSNVSLTVNGFDYLIPAANRSGNTARLTIYGQ